MPDSNAQGFGIVIYHCYVVSTLLAPRSSQSSVGYVIIQGMIASMITTIFDLGMELYSVSRGMWRILDAGVR